MGVLVRCGPGYQDLLVPPCGERKVDFGLLSLRPGPAERSWMGATPLAPHMLSLWQDWLPGNPLVLPVSRVREANSELVGVRLASARTHRIMLEEGPKGTHRTAC
jgi:hypothetical protein